MRCYTPVAGPYLELPGGEDEIFWRDGTLLFGISSERTVDKQPELPMLVDE